MEIDKIKELDINGEKLNIAIVLPYFNESLGLELLENTKKTLLQYGLKEENISITRVAGTLEIPYACQKIMDTEKPDAIIAPP